MRWVQEKRSSGKLSSAGREIVSRVQKILDGIPAELISQRATDCNEYARALFHLEQHAQNAEQRKSAPGAHNRLLDRLQDIYANIDEPDGLEGISAHLHDLDINQQILSHKKAGRWDAAQTWYEMQLAEKPDNVDVQLDLLNCLKQAGQHGSYRHELRFNDMLTRRYRCTIKPRRGHEHLERQQSHAICRGSRMGDRPVGKSCQVHKQIPGQYCSRLQHLHRDAV